ncbi:unknown [Clostridium sp. CAG:914]|nr:unknown [Clostridium sp. CAG:914]
MWVKKGCRDNFVMPTLSMLVIRGSCVAATTTMILVRARLTSTTTTVMPTIIGPPARFWSLVDYDAKHHGLLFKKDK